MIMLNFQASETLDLRDGFRQCRAYVQLQSSKAGQITASQWPLSFPNGLQAAFLKIQLLYAVQQIDGQ